MYYGIFYELWTLTDFDRLCKWPPLKKGGWNLSQKVPSPLTTITGFVMNFELLPILTDCAKGGMLNLLLLYWSLGGPLNLSPFKMVSVSAVFYPRWPPLAKNINFLKWPSPILARKCQNFNFISTNDLEHVTGFFWTLNFCRFWPIMQIWKLDEI